MIFAILTLILLAAMYLPQWWVRHVMKKHSQTLDGMPGTGAELAQHLVEKLELGDCKVEITEPFNDHFDPKDNCVRLSPNNYNGKSLTAVAVAAHEVGHAIQFNRNERISRLRGRYLPAAVMLKKIGIIIMSIVPIMALVIRIPGLIYFGIGISLLLQLLGALSYLIVLPEEWDASFNKALPILKQGNYVPEAYQDSIHQVLKAAALTYFAGALAEIVNIGRWWLLLRR